MAEANASSGAGHIVVDSSRCLRCAACSSLAPSLFVLEADGSRARRDALTDEERTLARAAALVCPAQAIAVLDAGDRA